MMKSAKNRLTDMLNIRHPILSAPMALAAGGALAAAVSRAGGFGLIGGGYGDPAWLEEQFAAAEGEHIGVGFITWALKKSPSMLTDVLKHKPGAVMLSFGDPRPFVEEIRKAGALLICQCQNIDHVWDAIDVGADIIVAQGSEAGGHGASRGTLSFVPEAADLLAEHAPNTVLLAAGGIADGRGLAAAQMLGADGVLVGTRFWASKEALVHDNHHAAIMEANGDETIRTTVPDIARRMDWPRGLTGRVMHNAYIRRWHGQEKELKQNLSEEAIKYAKAFAAGDVNNAAVWFGEAAGMIDEIESAGDIVIRIATQAEQLRAR
ncbi:MAG: nitronate monooxygenase [Cohaesibacter sp.]|nr:nitronate monooxygenase [Cohaesibacter sp.]